MDTTSLESFIKIAIADDHKIFRDGIKMALSDKKNLKMLWEAEDGKDMMHKIAIKMPDVLLMDIRMPEIDGINAIEQIRKEKPWKDSDRNASLFSKQTVCVSCSLHCIKALK